MSCWLCGNEKKDSHHLGCMRIAVPSLTRKVAIEAGLLAPDPTAKEAAPSKVEVLKEGSMTTVPEEEAEVEVSTCDYDGCPNKKYSDHPRVKYCEEHKDPKNRKE